MRALLALLLLVGSHAPALGADLHTGADTYRLTGTATDNTGVRELAFQVDEQAARGSWWHGRNADFRVSLPSGPGQTVTWAVDVPLVLGRNTVRVYAVDLAFNWAVTVQTIVRDPVSGLPLPPAAVGVR